MAGDSNGSVVYTGKPLRQPWKSFKGSGFLNVVLCSLNMHCEAIKEGIVVGDGGKCDLYTYNWKKHDNLRYCQPLWYLDQDIKFLSFTISQVSSNEILDLEHSTGLLCPLKSMQLKHSH